MRGPKPIPSVLKALAGNPGRRPLNPSEPTAPGHSGRAPRWLPRGGARLVWARIAPALVRARVLTELDETALALACCAIADYLDAREVPDRETLAAVARETEDDPSRRAELFEAILSRAKGSTAQLRAATALLAEFGLTPSSRSRIKLPQAIEEDDLDRFLGGGAA